MCFWFERAAFLWCMTPWLINWAPESSWDSPRGRLSAGRFTWLSKLCTRLTSSNWSQLHKNMKKKDLQSGNNPLSYKTNSFAFDLVLNPRIAVIAWSRRSPPFNFISGLVLMKRITFSITFKNYVSEPWCEVTFSKKGYPFGGVLCW